MLRIYWAKPIDRLITYFETDFLTKYLFLNGRHNHTCFFNSIKFNSILYYLCAESTATRSITDTAQCRYKNNTAIIQIIQ
jgi:hypothetical protein